MKIGSHVSNSGEEMLVLSIKEALSFDENAFMIYLGPPQNTMRKDYSRLNADKFRELLSLNNISSSTLNTTFFKFKIISVTSSTTPGNAINS